MCVRERERERETSRFCVLMATSRLLSNVAATILLPCFNLQQLVSLKEHCEVYANEHENVSSDVRSRTSIAFILDGSSGNA